MARRSVVNESKKVVEDKHEIVINRFADPRVIGPGEWIAIHTLAINAKSTEEKKDFCRSLRLLINTFRCSNCRTHAVTYMESNPPEIHAIIVVEKGHEDTVMFRYTWEFHNVVNRRLGKTHMPWEQAYSEYSNPSSMFCNTHCGTPQPPAFVSGKAAQAAPEYNSGITPYTNGKFDMESLKGNRLIRISARKE